MSISAAANQMQFFLQGPALMHVLAIVDRGQLINWLCQSQGTSFVTYSAPLSVLLPSAPQPLAMHLPPALPSVLSLSCACREYPLLG
jgi:hypothetical protein